MLIITRTVSRTPGDTVYIGKEVTVRVLSLRGNQVRLGIDAPPNVKILRDELEEHE